MYLYKNTFILAFGLLAIFVQCQLPKEHTDSNEIVRNKEAWEDSLELQEAYKLQAAFKLHVSPKVETDPVQADANEDAADDPALWYNANNPDSSVVFGTHKKSGVYAYDLSGRQTAFYPLGMINNIDVRQQVMVGDKQMDIIGGSNRSDNSIFIYEIDSMGKLVKIMDEDIKIDTSDIDEVYGFCLYKDTENKAFALVNGKNGKINQYILGLDAGGKYVLNFHESWQLTSQPEGMVADDELGFLYIGEEEQGIWKLSLNDKSQGINIIDESKKEINPAIEYDVEGLSIYYGPEGQGFLMASIQGNFSYALFDRIDNKYLKSFTILPAETIDGVEETDGLDIYSTSFGESFPFGILVVQDGFNYQDSTLTGQNFKYIDLKEVMDLHEQIP